MNILINILLFYFMILLMFIGMLRCEIFNVTNTEIQLGPNGTIKYDDISKYAIPLIVFTYFIFLIYIDLLFARKGKIFQNKILNVLWAFILFSIINVPTIFYIIGKYKDHPKCLVVSFIISVLLATILTVSLLIEILFKYHLIRLGI